MNKKGAADWTVGKLIATVLAVFLLVLIIWGITTGGFGPLFERFLGKSNEVLLLIGLKDEPAGADGCFESPIKDLTKGEEFLKAVGAESGVLTFCRDSVGTCKMHFWDGEKSEGYAIARRLKTDIAYSEDKSEKFLQWWNPEKNNVGAGQVREGDFDVLKFDKFKEGNEKSKLYHELYMAGEKFMEEKEIMEYYENAYSDRLVLYSEENGIFETFAGSSISLIWGSDILSVGSGGNSVYFEKDKFDEGFKIFFDDVWDGIDDKVYYKIHSPARPYSENFVKLDSLKELDLKNGVKWETIEGLIGENDAENSEIDSEKDQARVREAMNKKMKEFMEESGATAGSNFIDKFSYGESIEGKKILVGEEKKEFLVDADYEPGHLVVTLENGAEKYGIMFKSYASGKYPLVLGHKVDGKWAWLGHDQDYKMDSDKFKERYKLNKIYEFLDSKCG